jgi:undecaprenyl-diphosphatase
VDERLFHAVYAAHGGALTFPAALFTVLGGGWFLLLLVPLLFVRRHRQATLSLAAVLLVTTIVVALLKLLVKRDRPCNGLAGVRCLWGDGPTDYSFPSGHAAGSFAFAAFVAAIVLASTEPRSVRHAFGVGLLVASAGCVALSRVYLGVHFPGDVAVGAALGSLMGLAGARAHLARAARSRDPSGELPDGGRVDLSERRRQE